MPNEKVSVDKNLHNYSLKSVFTANRIIQPFFSLSSFMGTKFILFLSAHTQTNTHTHPICAPQGQSESIKKGKSSEKPNKSDRFKASFRFSGDVI